MAAKKKKASAAQLLARARFAAKFGRKKTGKRKAAKKRKAPKRRKATKAKRGKRRTKAAYMAHKGKLYQCLGPIKRGCGGGASVVVR
jgi:hypothetical protein